MLSEAIQRQGLLFKTELLWGSQNTVTSKSLGSSYHHDIECSTALETVMGKEWAGLASLRSLRHGKVQVVKDTDISAFVVSSYADHVSF